MELAAGEPGATPPSAVRWKLALTAVFCGVKENLTFCRCSAVRVFRNAVAAFATCSECHEMKGGLAQIDAKRMDLHFDDPPYQKLPSRSTCACRSIKRRTISLVGFSEAIRQAVLN